MRFCCTRVPQSDGRGSTAEQWQEIAGAGESRWIPMLDFRLTGFVTVGGGLAPDCISDGTL